MVWALDEMENGGSFLIKKRISKYFGEKKFENSENNSHVFLI